MVPALKHGDVVLAESGAIIVYLAETLGWDDVYPLGKDKAAERAKINFFLHWMHRNSREFSIGLFAPLLRKDLKFSPEVNNERGRAATMSAKFLEKELETHGASFLAGTKTPTLADFAVFADVGQCCKEDLDLFDFAPFPKLSVWMSKMKSLKGYEESHSLIDGLKPMIAQAKSKM